MSLPTDTDLKTMDYSYLGQPFIMVPAKPTIDTSTMDISYLGQPFVTNPAEVTSTINSNFFLFMPF